MNREQRRRLGRRVTYVEICLSGCCGEDLARDGRAERDGQNGRHGRGGSAVGALAPLPPGHGTDGLDGTGGTDGTGQGRPRGRRSSAT